MDSPERRTAGSRILVSNIRARKIGSNALSDKYTLPVKVETQFQDLALFVAHTGFTNIRNMTKTTDLDIIPIFPTVGEVSHFRPNRYGVEQGITCGISFTSLNVAWRLVSQKLIGTGNRLWYISEEHRFILYIQNEISVGTLGVFSDEEEDPSIESPFRVMFRPETICISIDTYITLYWSKGTGRYLFNAISIMFPQYMKRHELSINSITNRIHKLTLEIYTS